MKFPRLALIVLLTLLVSACSATSPELAEPPSTVGITELQIAVGTNDFPTRKPRVPILLFDGAERVQMQFVSKFQSLIYLPNFP